MQDAAGGRIRLVTLAPEHDGALPFIERLTASGVVVALGHTAATGARIRDAVARRRPAQHAPGQRLARRAAAPRQLHLGAARRRRAVGQPHLRRPSPAAGRGALPRARQDAGADDPDLRRQQPGRPAAGPLPRVGPGVRGAARAARSSCRARATWPARGAFTDLCVGNVIRFAGVSLRDAVDMAGARPRQLLGLPPRRLEPGEPADLVLFDWQPGGDFRVQATVTADGIRAAENQP